MLKSNQTRFSEFDVTSQLSARISDVEGYVISVTWRRARVVMFKKSWSIEFTNAPATRLLTCPSKYSHRLQVVFILSLKHAGKSLTANYKFLT